MIITLTMAEVKEFVSKGLAIKDFDLRISRVRPRVKTSGQVLIGEILHTFRVNGFFAPNSNTIAAGQKIPAIKCLREIIYAKAGNCGLGQAKYAVESFESFLSVIRRLGKFPKMGNADPDWMTQ